MLKNLFISLLLATPLLSNNLQAEIKTITNIVEIVPSVENDTLVFFNIAEVLTDSEISLGCSPWRKNIKKIAPNWIVNVHDSLTLLIASEIPHKCVESITPQLIEQWQNDGLAVMAFTSRGRSEWYDTKVEGVDKLTEKMLKNIGIDFSKTKLPIAFNNLDERYGPYYSKGIIYASHHEKDELLVEILQSTKYFPHKIVFIDDKIESLIKLQETMDKLGIPFEGYCYKRTAEEHKNFKPMIAHIQLYYFINNKVILSDEVAEKLLAKEYKDVNPDTFLFDLLNSHFVEKK